MNSIIPICTGTNVTFLIPSNNNQLQSMPVCSLIHWAYDPRNSLYPLHFYPFEVHMHRCRSPTTHRSRHQTQYTFIHSLNIINFINRFPWNEYPNPCINLLATLSEQFILWHSLSYHFSTWTFPSSFLDITYINLSPMHCFYYFQRLAWHSSNVPGCKCSLEHWKYFAVPNRLPCRASGLWPS